jgi:hypothetical protein
MMPRPRLTIRSLMIAVAAVGACLAVARAGAMTAFVAAFALAIATAAWLPTRRSPRVARRGFVASATWINLSIAAFYLFLPYLRWSLAFPAFLVSIPWIPTVAGFGLSWVEGRSGRAAKAGSAVLVAALVALPASMVWTRWPFFLGFYVSSPSLERLALRIEAGETFVGPEWAGLYRVGAAKRMFNGPDLGLVVGSDDTGDSVFIRSANSPRPGPGSGEELPTRAGVVGRWIFFDED